MNPNNLGWTIWIINGPQKYKRGHEQQRDDYID